MSAPLTHKCPVCHQPIRDASRLGMPHDDLARAACLGIAPEVHHECFGAGFRAETEMLVAGLRASVAVERLRQSMKTNTGEPDEPR